MKKVVIFGATSAIASATARFFARENAELVLIGRNEEKLQTVADDLKVLGASRVAVVVADLSETAKHTALLDNVRTELGRVDVALIAHGTLPDQKDGEVSYDKAFEILNTNGLSAISLMTLLANSMEEEGAGTIAVISSVAGDRGRQSNYIYGTAKGAVSLYAQGLRNRLSKKGVHIVTIKPGFVDTPMTADIKKGALWAQPEQVANDIYQAINKQKDVVYTPWFWCMIMLIIKCIPERIFKKLGL